MRFLVDVCAGHRLAEWLRQKGHDVAEVRERDPRLTDEQVLAWAVAEDRIIVTLDKDFGEMALRLGQPHRGILRLATLRVQQRLALADRVLQHHGDDLAAGAVVIATPTRTRVRRPPADV